jgi:hypothetical protein
LIALLLHVYFSSSLGDLFKLSFRGLASSMYAHSNMTLTLHEFNSKQVCHSWKRCLQHWIPALAKVPYPLN